MPVTTLNRCEDHLGEVPGGGQRSLQVGGKSLVRPVGTDGHGHGRGQAAQGVFDDHLISVGDEEETDGAAVSVLGPAEAVVDGVDVKVELADMLRFELPCLEFENNEASKPQVVEEQVDELFAAADEVPPPPPLPAITPSTAFSPSG